MTMSRPTIVYLSMFLLLGAGLWAVLAIGHGLSATADVSGYWQVRPAGTEVPSVGDGLEIEQSGKYLRLRTADGTRADLKLIAPSPTDDAKAPSVLRFAGGGVDLTIAGLPSTHRARMQLTAGGTDVSFDARRTVYQGRALAKDAPAARANPTPATQPLSASQTDTLDALER
jgi:hypothetical protein